MNPGHPAGARVVQGLRALYFDGTRMYGARGAELVVSEDAGRTWRGFGRLSFRPAYRAATHLRPAQRLARAEVYKLQRCGEHLVALARGGVYTGSAASGVLHLSFPVSRGSRPLSLAVGPEGEILFGEYHSNLERGPMRIYCSRDRDRWEVVHEFAAGEIRHVHGIYYDRHAGCFWVLVGDDGPEPGIARCSPDFSSVRFVRRGTQSVRAYSLLIRPEGLVFATDTERERNAIYAMDREGKTLQELQAIENSCFHSGTFGDWMFFSTACEPSPHNDERFLHLWASRDTRTWRKIAVYRKDRWPFWFQYGNLFFPEGETHRLEELVYSGTALRGADDVTVFVPLRALEGGGQ